jgi:hypothetical protein
MNLNALQRGKSESKHVDAKVSKYSSSPGATEGGREMLQLGQKAHNHRWELKGCPRCHGDVFLDSEDGDLLGHCLQCGYVGLIPVTAESVA